MSRYMPTSRPRPNISFRPTAVKPVLPTLTGALAPVQRPELAVITAQFVASQKATEAAQRATRIVK